MKEKTHKRIGKPLSIAAITAMTTAMMAAGVSFAATNYTPVAGTSCNFNKYLIMDAGDTVPNATFSFTVAPGQAISADTSSNAVMEVMAGVGTPTIADVTFAPTDSTATATTGLIDIARTNVQRGGTAGDTVQFDAGEKFATKQATIDFSSVSFPEPGIYRYIITETANTDHAAAGIIHDTDTDRVLDVYVIDAGEGSAAVTEAWIWNGTAYATEAEAIAAKGQSEGEITHREAADAVPGGLQVAEYVLHTNVGDVTIGATMGSADVQTAGAALADKTDGFTNEYVSKDLVFKKEVTGNQASRDKYFEFTATCTNIADDDVFVVSLADDSDANTTDGNADATSGAEKIGGTIAANAGKTNPTSVTGSQLKTGVKFYLQHGQSIAIRGLAPNAGYNITENAEDYKSTGAAVTGYTDAVSGTMSTVAGEHKAVMTSYQNQRDGIVPTGIFAKIWPAIPVVAAAIAGLVFLTIRKNKKKANQ